MNYLINLTYILLSCFNIHGGEMTPGDEMTFHWCLWGRNDYPLFYGDEMTPGDEMTFH